MNESWSLSLLNSTKTPMKNNTTSRSTQKRPLNFALCIALLLTFSVSFAQDIKAPSLAQGYPNKPIRLVVPFIAGSLVDVMGRAMAEEMQNTWKQSVVIDNKAGASTLLAAKMVATSPPDGYTLFLPTVTTFSMAPQLNPKAGIDPSKELTPIARLAITNLFLTTHPSLGTKNMKEWIELMRKNPGKFSYSSSGNGSPQHIFMETLKKQLNLDIVHIPYKGSNSGMLDLLSGKVDMAFIDGTLIAPNIKTGALVVLGSSMSKRSTLLPNVPPISDTVPGFDWSGWIGFAGPPNMPQPIVEKIADFIKHYQATPAFASVLEKAGIEPAEPISPNDMADFITKENKRWAPAIKISGATID